MKKMMLMVVAVLLIMCACGQTNDISSGASDSAAGGYSFTHNGVKLALDMPVDEVLHKLGEPEDQYTSLSCAFDGEDTVYFYPGFQLSTNNEQGYERIYAIYLEDGAVHTEEGIYVGCTREQVVAAYGQPNTATGDSLIYEKDGMSLRFNLNNGTVSSILYNVA